MLDGIGQMTNNRHARDKHELTHLLDRHVSPAIHKGARWGAVVNNRGPGIDLRGYAQLTK